jgi:cytochrome c oxidase subunit I
MTTAATSAVDHHAGSHGDHHEDLGFIRTYIFSTDHKRIAKQFLTVSLTFLILGGLLAGLVRWQLGFPGKPIPLIGNLLPETMAPGGIILPEFYNSLVTMHATFMIFFAIMPLTAGVFGNLLIPLQIGAADMAFPRINMLSFWLTIPAGAIMLASFFVEGGAAGAGWTSYAPLSSSGEYTGVYMGQVLWLISLIILGFSSITGALNYVTTIINMRAPGMTWFRIPLPTWALFITAWLLLLAIPILTGAMIMLLFDQTLGTSFFEPANGAGGEPLLWQHLFWFFGHPEVYILILPSMGIVSEIIANRARKPIFGYHAMVLAMIAIAFLGWIVWGHHMFMSGMNPTLGMSFMFTTVVIAVPSAIKTFNWLGTIWKGDVHLDTPMLHSLSFVSMFVIGGLSGIFMASTPVDIYFQDTYFIVAHIHYVLFGGSLFGIFAGLSYWFPKMYGRQMNETLGKIHWVLSFIFFNLAFFPMHNLGVQGHMRRIYDPNQYDFLQPLQPMNTFISYAVFALIASQVIFAANYIWSVFAGPKAEQNPWKSNGLEWALAPSPPPHGNFPLGAPSVYRGPYEYSSPESTDDYLPQHVPPQMINAPHEPARVAKH